MRKICEAVFLFVGTLGWWGFVYPDLCPGVEACEEETCQEEAYEAYEAGGGQARRDKPPGQEFFGQETAQSPDARAVFTQRENPWNFGGEGWQSGEIRIKSRLAEYICQIKENAAEEKRLDDEGQDCAGGGF